MRTFIDQLEAKLRQPLPGQAAQYKMAHVVRQNAQTPPENARQAGVLALFFPKADRWHLTLIQRNNDNPNDRHGGQISFPGGKRDRTDADLQATALREAEEEVGVPRQKVKLLGALTELYIPVSNFLVQPYVGFIDHTPDFRPQPQEVQAVLEVPFTELLDVRNRRFTDLRLTEQLLLRQVPYFSVGEHVVWGATAMMISELLEVVGQRVRE
ncbi:MAG: CoA pyrophosphatase [Bacteroidetes bacterium]|nr:MAG: CoA pyrophosphatase [Bacteroidota bacterium]PTM11645.1 MAG: CoA pyrophosphatase [Bacteroidota bacterium]